MPASREEKAAVWYGQKGYLVFPLHSIERGVCSCGRARCEAPGKHPRIVQWPESASNSPRMIRSWWRRWPNANIGLVTGEVSGVVVLDVDPRHGGEVSLEELEKEHGPLPETVTSQTGSGGLHLLFSHPGLRVPNSAGALGPGLDVRGDGGYIVAPPSLHACGRRYTWDGALHPLTMKPAPMPVWLKDKMLRPERGILAAFPKSPLSTLVMTGVREGQRNSSLARLVGHLLRHRIDPYVTLGLLKSWNQVNCVPPLSEAEMIKTIESIAGAEFRRRGHR